MREIKFRAWDNRYKRMHKEFGEGTAEVAVKGVNQTISDYIGDENWCIEQFTGLKDKNGKEIYEGDVVQNGKSRYMRTVVKFDETKKTGAGFNLAQGRYHEVIGNIHESPELLNPKPNAS